MGDWLCRSELMKCPTLLLVAPSEILNFWNFAVRRVYMPTDIYIYIYMYIYIYIYLLPIRPCLRSRIAR